MTDKTPKTAAIIVAAGRGTRAGGTVPKQWQTIAGRTVAAHTLDVFHNHPRVDVILFVHHMADTERAKAEAQTFGAHLVIGGATRDASVGAGLKTAQALGVSQVLIHDVARPGLPPELIDRVLQALETSPAAAPALALSDALWRGTGGMVVATVNRAGLYRAQTPQGFHLQPILEAHAAHPGGAADDVEVARSAGLDVAIVEGDEANLKITGPADFKRAEAILGSKALDIRLGNGFDVHKFGPGDAVVLCGVTVPFSKGLVGHSDADVGMHAVTDAIYGALAQGDIGQHFPPSDPQWKGADSNIFLSHAVRLASEMGFRINNVDCTLVCELPKIGPHAAAMVQAMAKIMDLRTDQVSVKATTSEQLGFTGRGEGIAALATATLISL